MGFYGNYRETNREEPDLKKRFHGRLKLREGDKKLMWLGLTLVAAAAVGGHYVGSEATMPPIERRGTKRGYGQLYDDYQPPHNTESPLSRFARR